MDELRSVYELEKKEKHALYEQKEAIMSKLSSLYADAQNARAANDADREAALALSAANTAIAW